MSNIDLEYNGLWFFDVEIELSENGEIWNVNKNGVRITQIYREKFELEGKGVKPGENQEIYLVRKTTGNLPSKHK